MTQTPRGSGGDEVIAFENASVVSMTEAQAVPEQTVMVSGGRIVWVGPSAGAVMPSGVRRVAARGKYLTPGLADMHCHMLSERDLLLNVAHGITTVRNMYGMPRHLAWRRGVGGGELTGPRIHTTGPILSGRPPRRLWYTSTWAPSQATKQPRTAQNTASHQSAAGVTTARIIGAILAVCAITQADDGSALTRRLLRLRRVVLGGISRAPAAQIRP